MKCPNTSKTSFDKLAAQIVAKKFKKWPYKCPDCDFWHLTTPKKKKAKVPA